MLLGRTVWTRDSGGWRREVLHEGAASEPVARLAEVLSDIPSERSIAVFEPDGIAHQTIDTPKVNRAAFASLARVRDQHPVVESENLGWGIEYPDPGPGGVFSTMIHSELTPGLVYVRDACDRAGCPLSSAWSAYTVAAACVKPGRSAPMRRFVLILTTEFCAVAACGGGKRFFKKWVGPMSERDWKAFSGTIGDNEASPSRSRAETGLRRGSIVVIAEGEPERTCPIWRDLRETGRVEAVLDLDAFASSAARIPTAHPGNLVEAFPRPRDLNRILVVTAIAGLSAAVGLGAAVFGERKQLRAEYETQRTRATDLEGRLRHLSHNQREMSHLRNEAPDGSGPRPVAMHEALAALAAAIPDALTLTSLTIGIDGGFELEAMVVGARFDSEDARRTLERSGFAPANDKGWVYDAGAARLWVRGKYGDARP